MTRLALAVALTFPLVSLGAQSGSTHKSIESANARYDAAYNRGDITEFVKVYSVDGTAMPPNGAAVRGREALTEWWQGGWKSGVRNLRLTTLEVFPHGNEATEIGRYALDVRSQRRATGAARWLRGVHPDVLARRPQ